jgi:hypothetical protein
MLPHLDAFNPINLTGLNSRPVRGKLSKMGKKPRLRVVEWVAGLPVIALCTGCNKEFMIPKRAASRTADAQENLQRQYDQHKCVEAAAPQLRGYPCPGK